MISMISPGKMYVWTLVLHECLSRFSVSFWLRHGDHPRSDTAQLSKSSLWYDFHVGKRRWGGLFGTFRQVFLTGKQNIPTQEWKHIQEDRIYESVAFVFVNGSIIIFAIHWHVGTFLLVPQAFLVYQETFFSHEISTTLCSSDSPTFSWTRSCLKTDFPTPWSQWSWCCKLRRVFVWWTSNPYMFQEIYIPRFLSNSCGMLGDECISRQTV